MIRRVYRIEGTVAVTFYVCAESEERAVAKAHRFINHEPPTVCGLPFYHKDLPEVSLSPAMTVLGIEAADIEQVEEGEPL